MRINEFRSLNCSISYWGDTDIGVIMFTGYTSNRELVVRVVCRIKQENKCDKSEKFHLKEEIRDQGWFESLGIILKCKHFFERDYEVIFY